MSINYKKATTLTTILHITLIVIYHQMRLESLLLKYLNF